MKTLVLTSVLAVALATSASAMVVKGNSWFGNNTNSIYETTAAYVGNPVYTSDGVMIGYVSQATALSDGNRTILVDFDDNFISNYAGWQFELNGEWRTTGELNVLWTADQLRSWIEANGALQSQS